MVTRSSPLHTNLNCCFLPINSVRCVSCHFLPLTDHLKFLKKKKLGHFFQRRHVFLHRKVSAGHLSPSTQPTLFIHAAWRSSNVQMLLCAGSLGRMAELNELTKRDAMNIPTLCLTCKLKWAPYRVNTNLSEEGRAEECIHWWYTFHPDFVWI